MGSAVGGARSDLCLFDLAEGATVGAAVGWRGVPEGLALRPIVIPGREEGRAAPEARPAA